MPLQLTLPWAPRLPGSPRLPGRREPPCCSQQSWGAVLVVTSLPFQWVGKQGREACERGRSRERPVFRLCRASPAPPGRPGGGGALAAFAASCQAAHLPGPRQSLGAVSIPCPEPGRSRGVTAAASARLSHLEQKRLKITGTIPSREHVPCG